MLFVELANGTSFNTPVRGDDVDEELQAWSESQFPLPANVLR